MRTLAELTTELNIEKLFFPYVKKWSAPYIIAQEKGTKDVLFFDFNEFALNHVLSATNIGQTIVECAAVTDDGKLLPTRAYVFIKD